MPSSRNSRQSDPLRALQTYSGYATAWRIAAIRRRTILERQQKVTSFQQLKPARHIDAGLVRNHLLRGHLTLQLIETIPVTRHTEFAMVSALWLPVQSYYAVHGYGMAALAAIGHTLPNTHATFVRCCAEAVVKRFFPEPFSLRLSGGYGGSGFLDPVIKGLASPQSGGTMVSNLATPTLTTHYAHIIRSLDTTRKRLIEKRFAGFRRKPPKSTKAKRRNVTKIEKRTTANKMHDTTIVDYLYRVRLRSNYEDPEMFVFEEDTGSTIIQFVIDTQAVVSHVCALLEAIVCRATESGVRDDIFRDIELISELKPKNPFAI